MLSSVNTMHSPGFSDTFYDTFFKQELSGYHHPSCSVPNSLNLDHQEALPPFPETSPLTPQSSYYSSSSPLSHTSLHSPESTCYDIDQCSTDSPINQCGTPSVGVPNSPAHIEACTSAIVDECTLDIAASLELIAEASSTATTPLGHYHSAYSYSPLHSSPFPRCATHSGYNGYTPHEDYELPQIMPNPDDLLVDPFGSASAKDIKPLIHSNPLTPLTPIMPIH